MAFSCLRAFPCLRAWGISLFLIGVVVSNRFTNYAISGVYMNFLTDYWGTPIFAAAMLISLKGALTSLFSIVGATYATQTKYGRYPVICLSLLPFIIGLGLFAVAALHQRSTGVNISLFSGSLLLTSIGEGMQMLTVFDFGCEQFKYQMGDEEKLAKWHAYKWWDAGRFVGTAGGLVASSLVKMSPDWWVYGGIFCAGLSLVTSLICILGRLCFHIEGVGGKISPIVDVLKVVVAAIKKRHLPYDAGLIYTENDSARENISNSAEKQEIQTTEEGLVMDQEKQFERQELGGVHEHSQNDKLRSRSCLIKASIIESPALVEIHVKKWRLCSSNKVKDAQILLGLLPLWSTLLIFQVVRATGKTFFLKQGFAMARSSISVAILLVFQSGSQLFITHLFLPLLKRVTKYNKGIPPLFRIGLGLSLSVCCCIVAGMVERWRLIELARNKPNKIPIFWLVPQCFLLGAAIGLADDGMSDFFESAVLPLNLRVCNRLSSESVKGVGLLINSAILAAIYLFSIPAPGRPWFPNELGTAHLDNLYFIIAGISTVNLLFYFFVSRQYNDQPPSNPENKSLPSSGDTRDTVLAGSSNEEVDRCCCS